jgi:hypothetical protein
MRSLALAPLAAVALLVLAGCDDATGTLQGGEALEDSSTPPTVQCEPTWTSLYTIYFGPLGQASCSPSGDSSCHGTASQTGAGFSGFVCGSTQDECWQGMTQGISPDAGGLFPPILPPDAGDPTQSQLWVSIHKTTGGGGLSNNMPCGNPPTCTATAATYTFKTADLSCLETWAQAGAPNN